MRYYSLYNRKLGQYDLLYGARNDSDAMQAIRHSLDEDSPVKQLLMSECDLYYIAEFDGQKGEFIPSKPQFVRTVGNIMSESEVAEDVQVSGDDI